MIDEAIARSAQAALANLAMGRWQNIHTEIQDDGTFVLLKADAPSMSEQELTTEQRAQVAAALDNIVPTHSNQDFGSWMVVFEKNGEIFASIYPGPGGL
jgi:hypothetical protein